MLPVTQQFGRSNLLLFLERFADFVAAILPAFFLGAGASGAQALILFAMANVVLSALLYAITVLLMVRSQPLFLPTWRHFDWSRVKRVATSAGWAAALVLSINIYLRFDTFFINLVFGASATVAFGIAVQLIGMVRQMTNGLVSGLDSVVAKLTNAGDTPSPAGRQLSESEVIGFSSYIQAMLTGNALVFIILGAEELIGLWVGAKVDDPAIVGLAAQMTTIMLVGMTFKALCEGWMNALNGTNQIALYTRYILPIALLNPAILMLLYWIASPLLSMSTVAWIYALLFGSANFLIALYIYSRERRESLHRMVQPIFRGLIFPMIGVILLVPVLMIAADAPEIAKLMLTAGVLGVLLTLDILLFVRGYRYPARRRRS
jgi:hypothetical protein